MATGLNTQLTRQIGEHLVTAELGRLGIIATPFSGNVPGTDILALANGVSAPIQVKAINGDSWQFDIRSFLNVTMTEKSQKVIGPRAIASKVVYDQGLKKVVVNTWELGFTVPLYERESKWKNRSWRS